MRFENGKITCCKFAWCPENNHAVCHCKKIIVPWKKLTLFGIRNIGHCNYSTHSIKGIVHCHCPTLGLGHTACLCVTYASSFPLWEATVCGMRRMKRSCSLPSPQKMVLFLFLAVTGIFVYICHQQINQPNTQIKLSIKISQSAMPAKFSPFIHSAPISKDLIVHSVYFDNRALRLSLHVYLVSVAPFLPVLHL